MGEWGGEVQGMWRGARDVARGGGSSDENDTLSSAWLPCEQCIHLFKEHRRFPNLFSHDASSMWSDDLRAEKFFTDLGGSVTDISLHPDQIRELAVEIRISSSVREFWHVARRSLRRSFNGASCHVAEKASRYRNSRLSPTVFSGYTVSPSRADCTWAVHSDHASRLLGSQGGDWRGRNTYFYDTMWYIWGMPPPFTAAQVITSSRSLRVSQPRYCSAVPCAPLSHLLHTS